MNNPFLHRDHRKIVDKNGREVILAGCGLGNWFLQEGYMWGDAPHQFDRSRKIEKVFRDFAGEAYAEYFWKEFHNRYVAREDIFYLKKLGYNSIRIPMNWRTLMEEIPGIHWKESGFEAIDKCLDWCEEAGIYAFLDLHGAPGGQTGANIDDCEDDIPRLFMSDDYWEKALALWEKLAARYKDREIVGGYDILNEPIAPGQGDKNFDHLIPRLDSFYKEAIARIRAVDPHHMLSIEGPHWATDLGIFEKRYDENMVLHFHRYAEKPDVACLKKFMDKAAQLDVPLWLGESGENCSEWYAALYPLCVSLGIGFNLWPWKKLGYTNCPCEIKPPKDYRLLMEFAAGGNHPGGEKARAILDEYLENIRLENCLLHDDVSRHVMRRPPFTMYAVDFDELPGKGISFGGLRGPNPLYRKNTGMEIICTEPKRENSFTFDSQWDRNSLRMQKGEFACYSFNGDKSTLTIDGIFPANTRVSVVCANETHTVEAAADTQAISFPAASSPVKITIESGEAILKRLIFK